MSLGTRLLRALWFIAKLGLFVGVAQFTVDEGLWGTSEQTEDMARRMGILSDENEEKQKKQEVSGPAEVSSLRLRSPPPPTKGGQFGFIVTVKCFFNIIFPLVLK